MVKAALKTQTFNLIEFRVKVLERDITEGECKLANKCMVKVAIARTLDQMYPIVGSHKVRVDAGHIKFNARGYRWLADTPKIARVNLIDFDKERKIAPFSFKVSARRVSQIRPGAAFTKERRRQIALAIKERERRTGVSERKRYTLRQRIVGFA